MPRRSNAQTLGVPRFEVDPSARLIACLRQAFPGFQPTVRWWVHVEGELKNANWRSHHQHHDAFCAGFRNMTSEDVIRFLQREQMIPAPPVDEYHRLADELSPSARKVLAALHEFDAKSLADKLTRQAIADRTLLTLNVIRRVFENELPYVQPALVQTRPGTAGGCWLTPEGMLLAVTIDKKILPANVVATHKPRIRRFTRA